CRHARQSSDHGLHDPFSVAEPASNAQSGYFLRICSISSITRFIFLMVSSSGSSVVMSTPASFRMSIGYLDPPEPRKVRYLRIAVGSPDSTFSDSADDAVNDVAYWNT